MEKLKISDLNPSMRRVTVQAIVKEISEPRNVVTRYGEARVATAVVGDDTGTIKLSLWNEQIDQVSVGDEVKIENGYVNEFRNEYYLNIGKYGKLKVKK